MQVGFWIAFWMPAPGASICDLAVPHTYEHIRAKTNHHITLSAKDTEHAIQYTSL
jgi:hypothetical protein